MDKIENPPAFPNTGNHTWSVRPTEGMALRDWFAGQALTGMMASPIGKFPQSNADEAASEAYIMADAMLAARKGSDHE